MLVEYCCKAIFSREDFVELPPVDIYDLQSWESRPFGVGVELFEALLNFASSFLPGEKNRDWAKPWLSFLRRADFQGVYFLGENISSVCLYLHFWWLTGCLLGTSYWWGFHHCRCLNIWKLSIWTQIFCPARKNTERLLYMSPRVPSIGSIIMRSSQSSSVSLDRNYHFHLCPQHKYDPAKFLCVIF